MGGGWFGYVVSIAGCGVTLALIAASTAVLYAYARTRGGRGPRVRVTSVSDAREER
ncbi:MAG: hypothetical protein H6719_12325 [Sandaracinaceae bacterium]|nr:hypothetical protein [Sandaracinaceae bacterium]